MTLILCMYSIHVHVHKCRTCVNMCYKLLLPMYMPANEIHMKNVQLCTLLYIVLTHS